MEAVDISHLTAEIEQYLFPIKGSDKRNIKQTLISIGDGGNEVGMGNV